MMNFRSFLEASRGMRVKIADKPNVYGVGTDRAWAQLLLGLAGKWVDVDTQHVFGKSFNAIHPDTGGIFHLDIKHVQDVENDVRPKMAKCEYCGATFRDVPDKHIGQPCPQCDKWPIVDLAVIDRLRPLVTVEKGKIKTVYPGKVLARTPEGLVRRVPRPRPPRSRGVPSGD